MVFYSTNDDKMGFHQGWIQTVMRCISTVTYSVLVNGSPTGFIQPSRGLRQGDLLSPYLFLICAEGFSAMLRQASVSQRLKGISICRGNPRLSHLFFADDNLLFSGATEREGDEIVKILKLYEEASGQKINTDKSSLFFSPNTPTGVKNNIRSILSIT